MFSTSGRYIAARHRSPWRKREGVSLRRSRVLVASRRNNSICISLKTLMWLTVPMSARDKIIRIAKRQCHIMSSHFDCCFIHQFNFAFRERALKTREERSPCRPGNASVEETKRDSIGRNCELLPISYFMVSFSLMGKKKKKT